MENSDVKQFMTLNLFAKNIAYARKLPVWKKYVSLFSKFLTVFLGFSIPFTALLFISLYTNPATTTASYSVLITAAVVYTLVFLYLARFFYKGFYHHFLSYIIQHNLREEFVIYHEKNIIHSAIKTEPVQATKKINRL